MGQIVNKKQLSEIIGVSEVTLTTWQKQGLPLCLKAKRGQSNQYDTEKVIQWMVKRERNNILKGKDGEILDYDEERARLTHHQANIASIKQLQEEGKLIPYDDVEKFVVNQSARVRAKLLSIPTKAAHRVIHIDVLTDAKDMLEEMVHEALTELSGGFEHDTDK